MTVIKICGITNKDDAYAALEAGVDMLGFIFCESPRRISPEAAACIIRSLPEGTKTVGVFMDEGPEVVDIIELCGLSYIQLHGSQSEGFASKLGSDRVIRALRIKDSESLSSIDGYRNAAFYLLDAYVSGQAGGTGHSFDWDLAIEAGRFGVPIILAGGLKPENAADAVRRVRPYGIDVSSGVELSPGVKDHKKIKELVANVRSVDHTA